MDNKKAVIGAIIILFISMIAFNLGDTTGQVIKDKVTTISVYPKIITAGEDIQITIKPGKYGVNKYVTIYSGLLRKGKSGRVCTTDFRCYDEITLVYKTSSEWDPGLYSAEVYDYYSSEYVKAEFNVEYPYNLNPHRIE